MSKLTDFAILATKPEHLVHYAPAKHPKKKATAFVQTGFANVVRNLNKPPLPMSENA